MERVLAIDIGNSNIVIGCYNECGSDYKSTKPDSAGKSVASAGKCICRLETRRKWTAEELKGRLAVFFQDSSIALESVSGGILSSVVPELNESILQAVRSLTGRTLLLMSPELQTGIQTEQYDESLLGTDRIVDMTAAAERYGAPAAVWDLGTATTLSVVDYSHTFRGGMITAGVQLNLNALGKETSQLPLLKASAPDTLLGLDTAGNMLSGTVAGTGILISGTTMLLKREPGLSRIRAVITGGLGKLVLPWVDPDLDVVYDPNLMLEGLYIIYTKNK